MKYLKKIANFNYSEILFEEGDLLKCYLSYVENIFLWNARTKDKIMIYKYRLTIQMLEENSFFCSILHLSF